MLFFPFRVNDPEGTLDKMNYRVLGKTGLTISEVGRALPVPKSAKDGVVFQPKLPKELARPRLRPARGIRRLDCAERSAAGFSGLANGGTELLLMGKSHGTISVARLLFHWRVPANVTPFKI